jgi:hypothetical protein
MRDRRNMPAMPLITASSPVPSGMSAATTAPKTISRSSSASGSATTSARCRSASSTTLKPLLIASTPVAWTLSLSELTFARSAG